MHLIYLPGNGPSNKDWIESVKKEFNSFSAGQILYYQHWQTGGNLIDFELETHRLQELISNQKDYIIFAKSAGTFLAAKAISQNLIHPQKCIFLGTPLSWGQENKFPYPTWFNHFSTPTLFLQHTQDPLASFSDLQKFILGQNITNCQLVDLPGDSHHYPELPQIRILVQSFLNSI